MLGSSCPDAPWDCHIYIHWGIPVRISFKKSTSLGNKKSFDIVKKKVCFQVAVFVGVGRLIL